MKRLVSAGILLLVTVCVLMGIHSYLNYVPEFEELTDFDPSRYHVTRQLQELKIKPNDRQWVLHSYRYYDGEGELQREELYEIDENGVAYYIAPNGNRIDSWRVADTNELTDHLESWNVIQEGFDSQGRITGRTASSPHTDGTYDSREILSWYYCPESKAEDTNTVCSYTRTMHLKVHPGEETFMYYGTDNIPIYEETGYEIMSYDKYGNDHQIWVEDPCRIITDAKGYVRMIYREVGSQGVLLRVDEFGRPVWLASYDLTDKTLTGYSIWTYEDLN